MQDTPLQQLFTQSHFLTASECNPEQEMPLPLLTERIIEVATHHANHLGIGYDDLMRQNNGWVLARVSIEMLRYPRVNEPYTLHTWIEDYNRRFSLRNMQIVGAQGETLGWVRTVWMVINYETRTGVDLTSLERIAGVRLDKECPIAPQGRMAPLSPQARSYDYTFKYTDCDVNRHVNTVRYIELLMNRFPLEKYDSEMVSRLDIAFMAETRYGDQVRVLCDDANPADCRLDIVDNAGAAHVRCRMAFTPR